MPNRKPASKSAKSSKASTPARKAVAKAPAKATLKPPSKTAAKPHARTPALKSAPHKPVVVHKPAAKAPQPMAKQPIKPGPRVEVAGQTASEVKVVPPPVQKPQPRMPLKNETVAVATASRTARPAADPVDADDSDSDGNLLSGPRNVTPYIAKRGEQYMSTEQLQHFRQILGSWKSDLMREVDRTVSHMKDEAANFPDPNDRATQEEEFSLELRTRDRERKLIRKIDEALQRIEDGSYGYCLETGEEIGIKRLEARPVATLSLEAQERRERREKQYGDRDDRYR